LKLESRVLIFENWFEITDMATDIKVKSTKNVRTKTAKEIGEMEF
jgi:hypothetical protein